MSIFRLLESVHKSLLMLGIIGSLQTYALIGVMTGGGPKPCNRNAPGTYIFHERFYRKSDGICLCNICSSPDFCIGIDFYTGKISGFRRFHEEMGNKLWEQ